MLSIGESVVRRYRDASATAKSSSLQHKIVD